MISATENQQGCVLLIILIKFSIKQENICFLFYPQKNHKAIYFSVSRTPFSRNTEDCVAGLLQITQRSSTWQSPMLVSQNHGGQTYLDSKSLNRFNVHQIQVFLVNNFLSDFTKNQTPNAPKRTRETDSLICCSSEVGQTHGRETVMRSHRCTVS